MATFSAVPMDEAQRLVMPQHRATLEQYCQYVRALSRDEAGQLELGPDDKPITERARLKAAAKAEGVYLHIQRKGNTVVFWLSDEPPNARAKPPAKPAGGGGRGRKKAGWPSRAVRTPVLNLRTDTAAPRDIAPAPSLTHEAQALIEKVDEGGVPMYTTANLIRIASENGVPTTSDMGPNEIIDALRQKA